jgi:hypothetical protein
LGDSKPLVADIQVKFHSGRVPILPLNSHDGINPF